MYVLWNTKIRIMTCFAVICCPFFIAFFMLIPAYLGKSPAVNWYNLSIIGFKWQKQRRGVKEKKGWGDNKKKFAIGSLIAFYFLLLLAGIFMEASFRNVSKLLKENFFFVDFLSSFTKYANTNRIMAWKNLRIFLVISPY